MLALALHAFETVQAASCHGHDTNCLNYLGFLKESGESEVSEMSDTLAV